MEDPQNQSQNQSQSQFNLLDGFVKEKDGKPSSSRLLILTWGLGTFLVWAFSSIKSETLQGVPDSVITILGVLIAGKTIQRFGE